MHCFSDSSTPVEHFCVSGKVLGPECVVGPNWHGLPSQSVQAHGGRDPNQKITACVIVGDDQFLEETRRGDRKDT